LNPFRGAYESLRAEIGKVIVGHHEIVEGTLIAIFGGGHVLLEGVPGLGKTLLVRTLSEVLDMSFNRIQFTPDLMPADILGTNIVMEVPGGRREFQFQRGPIFAHLVLADEINRATPKTQSAMLEAMQEKSVTAGGEIRKLAEPFFVLATQNPIDQEGTYPLPEAQLDRFFFKLIVGYPSGEELTEVLTRTTEGAQGGDQPRAGQGANRGVAKAGAAGAGGLARQGLRGAAGAGHASQDRNGRAHCQSVFAFRQQPARRPDAVAGGQGARADQGRFNVSFEDIQAVATAALRHRLILNFEAEAEGITTDHIIAQILKDVPRDAAAVEAYHKGPWRC
jgi:MoxR-like ATPase